MEKKKLKLNTGKTGLLTFSKSKKVTSLYVKLNGRSIECLSSIKFLGIHLDECLSYEKHINYLTSKLSSLCGLLRRLSDQLSIETIKMFYFSNIQSVLNYGIMFWGSGRDAQNVFKAQKRIIRCIFGLAPRISCREYFDGFGVLTAPSLYFLSLVMFIKKHPHLFPTNQDGYSRDMTTVTRNRDALGIPAHGSAFFERGPTYRAVKAYHMLPAGLRRIRGLNLFKQGVKRFLIEKRFYSFKFTE